MNVPSPGTGRTAGILAGLVAALATAPAVVACSAPQGPDGAGGGGAGSSVVLVVTASRNEPAPALPAAVRRRLAVLARGRAPATAVLLGPQRHPVTLPLTPRRPDGAVEHGPRREALVAANVDAVARAVAGAANTDPQVDELGLLELLPRTAAGPGEAVVVSSGLATGGALDVRTLDWETPAAGVAAELARRGYLPHLGGWRVTFAGLGDVVAPQPTLPQPQRQQLRALWQAVCRAAGAASCTVDDELLPAAPPHSTQPVPVVPALAVRSVTTATGVARVVPAGLLFDLASAQLRPEAAAVLGPVVHDAVAAGRPVRVVGHTDASTGTPATNLALSQDRARAVARFLVSAGLPAALLSDVRGVGSRDSSRADEQTDGRPDPAKARRRRVVVVEILGTPAAQR